MEPHALHALRDELLAAAASAPESHAALCLAAWEAHSPAPPLPAPTPLQASDRLALLLLLASSAPTLRLMARSSALWTPVAQGLRLTAKAHAATRKAALQLLRLGLAALREGGGGGGGSSAGWRALETLFAAVLDFPMHLLLSGLVQEALAALLPPLRQGGQAAQQALQLLKPPAAFSVPRPAEAPPAEWCALAVDVLIHHENAGVAKGVLSFLLRQAARLGPELPLSTVELIQSGSVRGAEGACGSSSSSGGGGGAAAPGLPAPAAAQLARAAAAPEGALASYSGACTSTDGTEEGVRERERWEHETWKLGAAPALAPQAAQPGAPPPLLLCLPPWHACGSLLAAIGGGALWPGGDGAAARTPIEAAARGGLAAYLQQRHPAAGFRVCVVRGVLGSLLPSRLAHCKMGLRVVLAALVQCMEAEVEADAGAEGGAQAQEQRGGEEEEEDLLSAEAIAALGRVHVEVSLNSSRAYAAGIAALLLRVLTCSGTRSPAMRTQLRSSNVAAVTHLLALLPGACVVGASGGAEGSPLARWLTAQAQAPGVLEAAAARYLRCEGSGSEGSAEGGSGGLTAVGLARAVAALPSSQLLELIRCRVVEACAASSSSSSSGGASSHPLRPLWLLQALCWAAWPGGGSGDAHLGVPVAGTQTAGYGGWEGQHPVHAEFCGAVRAAGGVLPAVPVEVPGSAASAAVAAAEAVVEGSGAEEEEDDLEALGRDMRATSSSAGAGAEAPGAARDAAGAAAPSAIQSALVALLQEPRLCAALPPALAQLLAPCLDAEGGGSGRAWAAELLFSAGMAAQSSSSSGGCPAYVRAAGALLLRAVKALQQGATGASGTTFACLLIWRLGDLGQLALPAGAGAGAPHALSAALLQEALAVVLALQPLPSSAPPLQRQAFEVHRWVATATLVGAVTAAGGGGVGPALPALAQAVTSALQHCSEAALPSLLACLGLLLEALAAAPAAGGAEEERAAEQCAAALEGAERAVWACQRPSRSIYLHYACAVARCAPLLAPALAPPLNRHLCRAVGALGRASVPPAALQVLTARLVGVWGGALALAGAADSAAGSAADSARARALLTSHVPLMLALALHREPLAVSEDPPLLDSASRRQFFGWLAARARGLPVEDEQACLRSAQGELLGVQFDSSGSGSAERAGAALAARGAGSLCRLQVLCFFDELALTHALRARRLVAGTGTTSSAPHALFPLHLQRALILRLCRLQAQPAWLAETSPGSPAHVLRLRAWQALVCLGASWGAGGGGGEVGGAEYVREADCWLPQGGGEGGGGGGAVAQGVTAAQLAQWSATCEEGGVGELLRLAAGGSAAPPPPPQQQAPAAPAPKAPSGGGGGGGRKAGGAGPAAAASAAAAAAAKATGEASLAAQLEMLQGADAEASAAAASAASAAGAAAAPALGSEKSDAAVAVALLLLVFSAQLHPPQQPSTRHYMEALSVALARRFPARAIAAALLPTLTNFRAKNQLAFSALLVAADAAMHLCRLAAGQAAEDGLELQLEEGPPAPAPAPQLHLHLHLPAPARPPARALALALLKGVFPWVTASVGLSRLLAHCALHAGLPLLYSTPHLASVPELAWLAPLLDMLEQCPDTAEQQKKTTLHLARVAPRAAASLAALVTSPVSEHGEVLPRDAFSYISGVFKSLSTARHREDISPLTPTDVMPPALKACLRAGLLPAAAAHHASLRWPLAREGGSGVFGLAQGAALPLLPGASASASAQGGNFQRKQGSAVDAGSGSSTGGSSSSSGSSSSDSLPTDALLQAGSALLQQHHRSSGSGGGDSAPPAPPLPRAASALPRPHPLLPHTGPTGRPHAGFIVCASLVDKGPNLGGLARTCEIFGAEALVVPEARVLGDAGFLSTSLDAERLLPIHAVAPGELVAYIRARRAQGYTAVALEQAVRSVALGGAACALPRRMLLVLGAEKEGLPVEVLAEVDVVVEIPQLGVLRSLNVHVSAALVVFEYVRQGLAALAGGAE